MRYLVILLVLCLSGCTAVPVMPNWPDVPKELLEACPDLSTVDANNDKLSTVIEVVSDNYKQYYDCKAKADDWITWYTGQQKIWKMLK